MNDDDLIVCGLEWAIKAIGYVILVGAIIMLLSNT